MKIRHVEIEEKPCDMPECVEYEARRSKDGALSFAPVGGDRTAEDGAGRRFQVVRWTTPGRSRPTLLGVEKTRLGLFNELAGMSAQELEREIERRTGAERAERLREKSYFQDQVVQAEARGFLRGNAAARGAGWWKRLFKKF